MTTLNAEQRQAVESNSKKILCLAGAGSGKTFSMLERVSRLVSEGVDPLSILVLTFTRAAAFDMKSRYLERYRGSSIVVPAFQTFHSFCYTVMLKDGPVRRKLGYNKAPTIINEGAEKRIKKTIKQQCNIKLSENKMAGKMPLSIQEKYQLELYRKAVARKMRSDNVISFDQLSKMICNLFKEKDPVILDYFDRYKYIFVDEFQDTDPQQWEFVSSFEDANLFLVGDALQSIYSFRNASPEIMKGLAEDKEWEVIKLVENYRSTEGIVNYANRMSRYAKSSYRIVMKPTREGKGVSVRSLNKSGRSGQVNQQCLEDMLEDIKKHEGESSAILCKTHSEGDIVSSFLDTNGIPVMRGKRNTDVTNILNSAINEEYLVDWCSTFLSVDKYAEFLRLCAIQEDDKPVDILHMYYSSYLIVGKYLKKVGEIKSILYADNLSPNDKCVRILEAFELGTHAINTEAKTEEEIAHFIIDYTESLYSSDVYVGTIHSSKGLEYDNVYLVGVNDASFKLKDEEQWNLYYVGVTRAKNNLRVYIYRDYYLQMFLGGSA